MDNKNFLGDKSYPAVVDRIFKTVQEAKPETLTGQEVLNTLYNKLNESITPMLEIKQFITNAESVTGSDKTIKDVVDFCKKATTNVDLNFVINLCKEEHLANMNRAGFPNPKDTIKDIEEEFGKPVSSIEQGIKSGIFDKLDSKLFNAIKGQYEPIENNQAPKDDVKDTKETVEDDLNEGIKIQTNFKTDFNGNIAYNPVGIVMEDSKNNQMVILCESDVLTFNNETKQYRKIDTIDEIPENYNRLMESITQTNYNPETKIFSLNENWDFNLILSNGKTYVGKDISKMSEIPVDKIQSLLLESINLYTQNPTLVENFNRNQYIKDADNFVMLAENANMLYNLDKLMVYRNTNKQNSYVMVDLNEQTQPILLSINGERGNVEFDSFTSLCEAIKDNNEFNCTNLFESQLNNEKQLINNKIDNIDRIKTDISNLNENISKTKKLMKHADVDSPAMEKLSTNLSSLNESLDNSLEELNFYENEYKLY